MHFRLLDDVHPSYNNHRFRFKLHKRKRIKSSNGQMQERPCIRTDVVMLGRRYKATITLTGRADMKYPMLIGRKYLHGRFLVDVSRKYVSKDES